MNVVAIDNNKQDLSRLADALAAIVPLCHIQSFTDPLLSAKYICNSPVDFVFLAECMHPVDGFVLLKVLRTNMPSLPIVMLSDRGLRGEDARNAGVNGYFTKPIAAKTLKELSEDIYNHLQAGRQGPGAFAISSESITLSTQKRREIHTMEQNEKFEALSQDTIFVNALGNCETAADAQKLFEANGIALSGEALLETCLTLLKCGEKSGALSEEDLLQVAAGASGKMSLFMADMAVNGLGTAQAPKTYKPKSWY